MWRATLFPRRACRWILGLAGLTAWLGTGASWWVSGVIMPRATLLQGVAAGASVGGTLTSNGEFFLARHGSRLEIYDTLTGRKHIIGPPSVAQRQLPDGRIKPASVIENAVLSRDGTRVVTAAYDEPVRIWDTASGRVLAALDLGKEEASFLAMSPDGRKVLIISWRTRSSMLGFSSVRPGGPRFGSEQVDGQTRYWLYGSSKATLWQVATGKRQRALSEEQSIGEATFSPDGGTVAFFCSTSVKLLHIATGQVRDLSVGNVTDAFAGIHHGDKFTLGSLQLSFSPNGQYLAGTDLAGTVTIWEVVSGRQVARYSVPVSSRNALLHEPVPLALGNGLAAVAYVQGDPRKVSAPSWLPQWASRLANLYLYRPYQVVEILDATTGRKQALIRIRRIPAEQGDEPCQVAFLSEGATLVTYDSGEDCLKLWDIPPRTLLPTFAPWLATILALFLSTGWWYVGRRRRNTSMEGPQPASQEAEVNPLRHDLILLKANISQECKR